MQAEEAAAAGRKKAAEDLASDLADIQKRRFAAIVDELTAITDARIAEQEAQFEAEKEAV